MNFIGPILDKVKVIYKYTIPEAVCSPPCFNLIDLCLDLEKENFFVVKEWTSDKTQNYHYNYTFKLKDAEEGIIYCGFDDNLKHNKICIEYNPAKVTLPSTIYAFLSFYNFSFCDISYVDIAFDFPLPISRFCRIPNDLRQVLLTYGPLLNQTLYIGHAHQDGQIKIYNKTLERKQAVSEDLPTFTRVELTLCKPLIYTPDSLLDTINKYLSQVVILGDYETDDPLLYMFLHSDEKTVHEAFRLMSVNTRTKYKKKMQLTTSASSLTSSTFTLSSVTSLLTLFLRCCSV